METYERERTIGRGTFGEVVKYTRKRKGGRDNEEEDERDWANEVAIKALDKRKLSRARASATRTMLDDAKEEAMLMAECESENVVRVYEWIDDARSEKVYIVMEFCANGAVLSDDDEFEAFAIETIKDIIRDVLRALVECHARGVVHYDVKPQNIFNHASGARKLGDFGSAKRVEKNKDGTYALVRTTPGTPAFTAPECCEGEPCDGFKADVWAVGITAHALATGSYAYRADGAWNTYQLILTQEIDLSAIKDSMFRDFLSKVLDRNPNTRLTARQALEHEWFHH